MNPLIELDQLNLDPATQTPVAAMILKPSAKRQAFEQLQAKDMELQIPQAALQAKDAEIKHKDLKIDALIFELARLRRI